MSMFKITKKVYSMNHHFLFLNTKRISRYSIKNSSYVQFYLLSTREIKIHLR